MFKRFLLTLTPLFVGLISSFYTSDNISTWYVGIEKSELTPPNWIFGPVWTVLFLMMGVALSLVATKSSPYKKTAEILFGAQLTLNFAWSFLFFEFHLLGWALLEIVLLWAFIFMTIVYFHKVSKLAAYLLVPYLLWVSFATYLTFMVWKLN